MTSTPIHDDHVLSPSRRALASKARLLKPAGNISSPNRWLTVL